MRCDVEYSDVIYPIHERPSFEFVFGMLASFFTYWRFFLYQQWLCNDLWVVGVSVCVFSLNGTHVE